MSPLYETDPNLWYEETIKALKTRNFDAVDWDNLIDELDDMGRSEKRALESYLQRLIEHILKLKYWTTEINRCSAGWKSEVSNFRNRIKRILRKNPSLKSYLEKEYLEIYTDAKQNMSFNFNIPAEDFVESQIILEENYFG